jgi:hypothetical protein
MLFEVHGLILALHHDARFLRSPDAPQRARLAFERVVAQASARAPGVAPAPAGRPARSPRPASRTRI